MAQPRWQRLVRELQDRGFESLYLDRLRSRIDVEQAQTELEQEIRYEMACALGRAEEKLNLALLRLELAHAEIEAAGTLAERKRLVRSYNQLRERAVQARFDFMVHREAVGIRRNDVLESLYPIPKRRPEY
jgi:hypothetical protein